MDPWDWDAEQVVQHLCYSDQAQFTADKDALEKRLRDHDVDGKTLLTLDTQDIKEDLGLTRLGPRKGLLRVLASLQQRSPGYIQHVQDHQVFHVNANARLAPGLGFSPTPPSLDRSPQNLAFRGVLPQTATNLASPLPRKRSLESTLPPPRKRATLTAVAKTPEANISGLSLKYMQTDKANANLSHAAIDLEDFFYSNSKCGDEIGDSASDDEQDIVFTSNGRRKPPPGSTNFAIKRLHYFLRRDFRPVKGNDKKLVSRCYPERLLRDGKRQSVSLYRADSGSLTRRDAVLLDDIDGAPDEWDRFLPRDVESAKQEEVSEIDDNASISSSLADEIEREQAERKNVAQEQMLTREQATTIVDREIDKFRIYWRDTHQPKQERKKYQTWMKSRSVRHGRPMVQKIQDDAASFVKRLSQQKNHILANQWNSEAPLIHQCKSMDLSVFALEKARFLLGVFDLRVAPPQLTTTEAPKAKDKTRVDAGDDEESIASSSDSGGDDFVVDDDTAETIKVDEPSPSKTSPSDSFHDIDEVMSDDQTPQNSSHRSLAHLDATDLTQRAESPSVKEEIEPATPATTSDTVMDGPIEINSDDDADNLNAHKPELARFDDIAKWSLDELEQRRDRKRIVLKMLQQHPRRRESIYRYLFRAAVGSSENRDRMDTLIDDAYDNIQKMRKDSSGEIVQMVKVRNPASDTMRLFICWLHGDSRYFQFEKACRLEDQHAQEVEAALSYDFAPLKFFLQQTEPIWEGQPIEISSDEQSVSEDEELNEEELADLDKHTPRKKASRGAQNSRARQMIQSAEARRKEDNMRREANKIKLLSVSGNIDELEKRRFINPGAKESEAFIPIDNRIAGMIKEHQINGVQFMWRELVTDDENAQGCLLAHTMGLGKTMQTITLLTTLESAALDATLSAQIPPSLHIIRYVVICPAALVSNWVEEFVKWSPRTSALGQPFTFQLESHKETIHDKYRTVESWNQLGGVLILSYEAFRSLVQNKGRLPEEAHSVLAKWLLEDPVIVVADEAHKMKNANSGIGATTARFSTNRRIALTGTPLSNNTAEYFSMINWVSPGFLGERSDFTSRFQKPIEEGIKADASRYAQRNSLKRLKTLGKIIANKTHRADISVLAKDLKPKTEFVITLPMNEDQKALYRCYIGFLMEGKVDEMGQARLWAVTGALALLLIDPYLFVQKLNENSGKGRKTAMSEEDDSPLIEATEQAETIITAVTSLAEQRGITGPLQERTPKLSIILEVARLCKAAGEQLLIFSHRLRTLSLIQELLRENGIITDRVDGTTKLHERQVLTKNLGTSRSAADAMVISTRAGGLGLNIQAASRVVLVDFGWDPSHEEQAIGRAYRIGQRKQVYVYHLVTGGTFESTLHNVVIFKKQLAARVVDQKNPQRSSISARDYIFMPEDPPVDEEQKAAVEGKDAAVLDQILASSLGDSVRGIQTTETLHQEIEESLDPDEEKEVEDMIRFERSRASGGTVHVAGLERFDAQALAQYNLLRASQQHAALAGGQSANFWGGVMPPSISDAVAGSSAGASSEQSAPPVRPARQQQDIDRYWKQVFGPLFQEYTVPRELSRGGRVYTIEQIQRVKKFMEREGIGFGDVATFEAKRAALAPEL